MWCTRIVICGFLLLASAAFVVAQSSQTDPQPAPGTGPSAVRRSRASGPQIPCWRQAGIAPSMVNQRWKIEDQGKVRIANVCNDASLSAEKKHSQIQQINEETEQEVARLIPAKQLQEFKACQVEWNKSHPKPAGEKELGPCGGVIPPSPTTTAGAESHTHNHSANSSPN